MANIQSNIRMEIRDFVGRKVDFNALSRRAQRVILREGLTDAKNELIKGAMQVRNTAIESMRNSPADTTRARYISAKAHYPSYPFNPPRPDTGGLIRSLLMDVESRFSSINVRMGSTIKKPPYPIFLEFGTDKMAPRPWLDPAYQKHQYHVYWKAKMALINAAKRVLKTT